MKIGFLDTSSRDCDSKFGEQQVAITEETYSGAGGLAIFFRSWIPEAKPRAVVVICHGVLSHSGYYFWAAEQLVKSGFATYALDLRGRGKSEGERYYVENVANYVSDVLVLSEGNPRPGVATFQFTPMSGKAEASTRIRLAATQNIVVVAKTSGGQFFTDQKLVKVTIGGCGG